MFKAIKQFFNNYLFIAFIGIIRIIRIFRLLWFLRFLLLFRTLPKHLQLRKSRCLTKLPFHVQLNFSRCTTAELKMFNWRTLGQLAENRTISATAKQQLSPFLPIIAVKQPPPPPLGRCPLRDFFQGTSYRTPFLCIFLCNRTHAQNLCTTFVLCKTTPHKTLTYWFIV